MIATIRQLTYALLMSWGEDTMLFGDFDIRTPSLNQCAPTALVVQDYLGGDMLRRMMDNGYSHYWNRLPDRQEIDLSADQLRSTGRLFVGPVIVRERAYVLSFPDTLNRYTILKQRVAEELASPSFGRLEA